MALSKIFQTLQVLKKDEWSSYRKYLLMHFREESDSFLCFKSIQAQKDKLGNRGIEEKLRKKHFPDMSTKAYSNMLSKLFVHFENWFATNSFLEEEYSKKLQLVKAYNQRGLYKLANQHANKLEAYIKAEPYLHINQNKALTELYNIQYYSNNPIKKAKDSKLYQQCLQTFIATTNEFSYNYLLELENISSIKGVDYAHFREVLLKVTTAADHSALSKIFEYAFIMMRDKSEEAYHLLKEALIDDSLDRTKDSFLVLALYLNKMSILFWLKSRIKVEDVKIAFELYLSAYENSKYQKLSYTMLANSVSFIGTALSYEDTQTFIDDWIDKISTNEKDAVYKFCQALNAFRHDRYEEIPQLLQGLHFSNQFYKLNVSLLYIITMYKLEEYDLAITQILNFKKQLKRNRDILNNIKEQQLTNTARLIDKLCKVSPAEKMQIDLNDYKPLFYQSWALKELN